LFERLDFARDAIQVVEDDDVRLDSRRTYGRGAQEGDRKESGAKQDPYQAVSSDHESNLLNAKAVEGLDNKKIDISQT
jgi:hypothetical protein